MSRCVGGEGGGLLDAVLCGLSVWVWVLVLYVEQCSSCVCWGCQ